MLDIYSVRLLFHIRALHIYLTHQSSKTVKDFVEDDDIKRLEEMCQQYLSSKDQTALNRVIELCSIIAGGRSEDASIKPDPSQIRIARLVRLLYFVARVRKAYEKFIETAIKFPSFRNISFVCTPCPSFRPFVRAHLRTPFPSSVPPDRSGDTLNAAELFRMEARYRSLLSEKLHVHAEINLVFFLGGEQGDTKATFPYLGISKKSCFLCGNFIRYLGHFETRGEHHVEYTRWTFPSVYQLKNCQGRRFSNAYKKLQAIVQHRCKHWRKKHLPLTAESTAAASGPISEIGQREADAHWKHSR